MLRTKYAGLTLAGLCLALVAACGGSGTVTGGDDVADPAAAGTVGNATLQGSVVNGHEGLNVDVVGTSLTTRTDEEGQFALSSVPAGTVTLLFHGAGVNAQLVVPGVQDNQVTTITVNVSGSNAQMPTAPTCQPTSDTFFTGVIESITGQTFVIAGRTVDVSQVRKIWRGSRRIYLEDLSVGEKVKVWGTLRSDGVVMADEIALMCGEPGDDGVSWIAFNGVVEAVLSSLQECVYPVLIVSGKRVITGSGTSFARADGSTYDGAELRVGDRVYVEGWKQRNESINATLVRR